ncbi:23S rRNA (uracil(1939)-C(5))-methyltransferase RlmD [Mycoplasma phocoeninasale]|uniref:23S rRNA (uracil(1939)-C(5))-methyltransferase RlmD n=1 Tax=Mycoplasma phocoeninasale TaxID=2726117 RepID=UPI001967FE62|nr:23S rRNA (uracil(1939)-C(5))-methyltransferase RlmD [Mycoplasma phocoeninasale]MBN0970489.1 23S rRNA (uracil(1939)-C(5))-methyltransferase RlmD [Mycoplasma phocoeninasale]
MNLEINQILQVKAEKLSYEGYGECRIDNFPIFVESLLPNEEAKIIIKQLNSKFAFAEVLEIYQESAIRNKDIKNTQLLKSGSAMLMHLNYDEQLKFKQSIVDSLFLRELNFKEIKTITPSPSIWNYRNKISIKIDNNKNKIKHGFYKKRSHDLVEQTSYDLVSERLNSIIFEIINIINNSNKKINWVKENKIFEITFKHSIFTNEIQMIFHSLSNKRVNSTFLSEIKEKFNEISIINNIYNQANKLQKREILLNNMDINFKLNELILSVNSDAFYQVNELQTINVYSDIKDLIERDEKVLDAFSGVSSIGIFVADKVSKITSVEINDLSTKSAKKNIVQNKINNLEIINEDVRNFLLKHQYYFDSIIVDPPRNGLDIDVINSFINSKISKIVYLSCNPRTLVRDLKVFVENGYHIEYVKPYDMFPQTPHVECLVLLKKN